MNHDPDATLAEHMATVADADAWHHEALEPDPHHHLREVHLTVRVLVDLAHPALHPGWLDTMADDLAVQLTAAIASEAPPMLTVWGAVQYVMGSGPATLLPPAGAR